MPTKRQNKTQPTSIIPDSFIASQGFTPEQEEAARTLITLFERVTGKKCVMWGKIFGFGKFYYQGKSCEGEWMITGFALRKAAITIYIMSGAQQYGELLKDLGKHTVSGGSCVYVKKLSDIDLKVLEQLVKQGVKDISKFSAYIRTSSE